MSKGTEKSSFFEKLATVIVDKRNLIFFLYACALIFCLFSRNWVSVCNDITEYLPETTETRQGLTLMEEEFTTFGTARVPKAKAATAWAPPIKNTRSTPAMEAAAKMSGFGLPSLPGGVTIINSSTPAILAGMAFISTEDG